MREYTMEDYDYRLPDDADVPQDPLFSEDWTYNSFGAEDDDE